MSYLVGMIIGAFCGLMFGGVMQLSTDRDEAIKHKVGEYYLDEDNNRQFRYIEPTLIEKWKEEKQFSGFRLCISPWWCTVIGTF